jgi:hypothetical protein
MPAQRAKDNLAQAEALKADGLGCGQIMPPSFRFSFRRGRSLNHRLPSGKTPACFGNRRNQERRVGQRQRATMSELLMHFMAGDGSLSHAYAHGPRL